MEKKTVIMSLFLVLVVGVAAIFSRQKIVSPIEAGKIVQDILNNNFIQNKDAKVEGKVAEEKGLYKVNISIGKVINTFYLTKDGSGIIFPDGIVSVAKLQELEITKTTKKAEIPKTGKPRVELYVMSLCPFGTKAEKRVLSLIDDFGDKIDFKIRYIVTAKGETLKDIISLHGQDEVKENVRQAAVLRYYPDRFSLYLDKIDKKSCLMSCGEVKLDDYWKQAAGELRMDVKRIESFAYGPQGLALLKQDAADAKERGISASPTLVINGVVSDSIYTEDKAIKNAVCSAFSDLPAACRKNSGAGS